MIKNRRAQVNLPKSVDSYELWHVHPLSLKRLKFIDKIVEMKQDHLRELTYVSESVAASYGIDHA